MSGVEAAGFVLAAIPLVISALEHYAEGVETIQKWWRYQKELSSLKRVLGAEYDRYLNTCEELLAGIVPDAELAALLDSPGGVGWKNPDIERKLKARLRKSFTSYLDTVTDLNNIVEQLKTKLELDPKGKPRWSDARTFRREYKRIKFSLSSAKFEELVKKIEKDNDTLANLTSQSIRLEPTRTRRKNPTTDFERVRAQAESLYRVLKRNFCGSCSLPHKASLRLEARTSSGDAESTGKMRFRMVFAFDPSQTGSPNPWKPKETDIEPLDICEASSYIAPSPAPYPSISHSPSPGQGTISIRPKRGVRWASDSMQPASHTPTRSTSSLPLGPMMTQIQSICTAFKDSKGDETCLGFIVDETVMRHHIYPTKVLHPETATSISLYKRLSSSPQNRNTKLTRKERLQLALTLASTVLQLHKTPWLSERWGKKDILFLNGNVPYVSKTFLGAGNPPAHIPDAPTKTLPVVRNETIFALGVILIELCLGSALEDMRSPEDLSDDGTPNALTDYLTARRMVNEVYDEGGGRYGDAVRRCIHCEFDQRIASLDVEVFRTCFYQGVVQPLEDDWMEFSSMTAGSRAILN